MLTLQDCIGLCDLSEDEVAAIAEHEHIPDIVAAELGNYLCHTPEGERAIRSIILDDIDKARECGDLKHAFALRMVLRHFVRTHPDHARGASPKQPLPKRNAS